MIQKFPLNRKTTGITSEEIRREEKQRVTTKKKKKIEPHTNKKPKWP